MATTILTTQPTFTSSRTDSIRKYQNPFITRRIFEIMHRRQFMATLGAISFAGCQALPTTQTEVTVEPTQQTWNQYRGGPKKEGYTSNTYPTDTPINLHFDYRLKYSATPVRNSQEVLIPTTENIVAIDPRDRTEKYRIPRASLPTLPPAVSSDVLLLVTGEALHGYDLEDKSLKWKTPAAATHGKGAAPVAFSEHFIVQDGNRLRCIEHHEGSTIWERSLDARVAGFAATPTSVVVHRQAEATAELIALNTATGNQKWTLETPPSLSPPIPGEETYIVSDSGRLSAIQDGTVAWDVDTDLVNPKAISENDGYVLLGPDDSDRFIAIDSADRSEAWRTEFEFASAPLLASESVFVPTANEGIHALNLSSGTHERTYSEARFIDYLVPYEDGLVLSRQSDERIGFMQFNRP